MVRTETPEPQVPITYPSRAELVTAAQSWIDASYYAVSPERQELLLRSTAALIKAGRFSEAKEILDGMDVSGLPARFLERKRLLRIQMALAQEQPELASRYLARYRRLNELDPEFRSQILGLSAQAYLLSNESMRAVDDLIRREQYLTDLTELQDNRERIWHALGAVKQIDLQIAQQSTANAALSDWLDLALLYGEFGADAYRTRQILDEWIQINPRGSAQKFAAEMLRMSGPPTSAQGAPIIKVALLLPLASKFGAAAQAVNNGFMAMRTLDGNPLKPEVAVYDIGEVPELANSYHQLAINEGANLIIGPLGKQAATAIIGNRAGSYVPTILLGGISQNSALPSNTYQIDLAPEQEADQTALQAYLDGQRVAAVLRPDSEWGQRIAQAFTDRWTSLGGIIASTQVYDEAANDHSFAIKQMLDLNFSEGRNNALSAALGTSLEFRPRRRQDLDIIFLAARPDPGRLIKPQINFYQGHDIPVYSTSQIFSGTQDSVNDTDLNRVIFGDMPWLLRNDNRTVMLRSAIEAPNPPPDGLQRLFALGMDVYLLSGVIPYLEPGAGTVLRGVSGDQLVIRNSGHIDRRLSWARFENGIPELLYDKEVSYFYESIQSDTWTRPGGSSGAGSAGGTTSATFPN
ncbi:penicillin-binding protein activator [Pseudomonadota bacterium]